MERRDRHDIVLTMLKVAKIPIPKTRLMYRARLSYAQLENYLDLLMDRGLIENCGTEDETLYKTTKKGLAFVEHLELVEKLWEI